MQKIKEVKITRLMNAPREFVYKVWTEGAHGFLAQVCEVDVRPGGSILIHEDHPAFPNHVKRYIS